MVDLDSQLAGEHRARVVWGFVETLELGASVESVRKRLWLHAREPEPIKAWRQRMASAAGQQIYGRRKHSERAHAHMKNRSRRRLLVRGLARIRAVALIHAIAHNLWRAHRLRQAAA